MTRSPPFRTRQRRSAQATEMTTAVSTRKGSRAGRPTLIAWGFAAPFLVLFLIFMAGPIIASFVMSFPDLTTRDLRTAFNVNIVGLDNYVRLFQDERFV